MLTDSKEVCNFLQNFKRGLNLKGNKKRKKKYKKKEDESKNYKDKIM